MENLGKVVKCDFEIQQLTIDTKESMQSRNLKFCDFLTDCPVEFSDFILYGYY
jgi:hypothetical protein